ncbi:lantibiotic dehydratase family protein [Flagellimonas onchidii]|uniref:lantibiotic dehydratase family protein n=1 Tax=Flagellimonas onchidii TaxID=2562684 RepID=UPI0010A5ACBE|nr:lantibiotic dehydratase family protein [Allomuricauda onchidii]
MSVEFDYHILDSFVLREPLMPVNLFLDLASGSQISDEAIKQHLQNKDIREAIFIASPSFWNQVEKWENDNCTDFKKAEKVKMSILKYLARLSVRATPFGLFAGCSIEYFDSPNEPDRTAPQVTRKTFISHTCLEDLLKKIFAKRFKNCTYLTNNTLYEIGDKLRYVRQIDSKGTTSFVIEELSKSDELSKILNKAKSGAHISELGNLIQHRGVTLSEANEFIEELIKIQLINRDIRPSLYEQNPLSYVSLLLKGIGQNSIAKVLEEANNQLIEIDSGRFDKIPQYKRVLNKLLLVDELNQSPIIFNVISYNTTGLILSKKTKQHFLNAVKIMKILNSGHKEKRLEDFKIQFEKRYGDRKVRLLNLLDPDYGIDYLSVSSNLGVSKIMTSFMSEKESYPEMNLGSIDLMIARKVAHANLNNEEEIEINDIDLTHYRNNHENIPDTFSGIFEIIKKKEEELVRLRSLGGSSALNLISRFTIGSDAFCDYAKKISNIEQKLRKDQIIAEVVHIPESGLETILVRSDYIKYKIPILADLNHENCIQLDDLSVFLNNGTIILWSERLQSEIIPSINTSHNFESSSLPIYRFLCDLQSQNKNSALSPDFDYLGKIFLHIPRIVYKGIIVSPALWCLEKELFKIFHENLDDNHKLLSEGEKLRKEYRIPKLVLYIQGDSEILVNLENVDCLKYFLQLIKNQSKVLLHEFLFDSHTYQNDNVHANEVVVTYYKKEERKQYG